MLPALKKPSLIAGMIKVAIIFILEMTNPSNIYATAYSWELGGHNCDHTCGKVAMGLNTRHELLGKVAACPEAWLGAYIDEDVTPLAERWDYTTVLTLADGSQWWCVDTFGDAHNRKPICLTIDAYHEGDQCTPVYRVDFAVASPLDFSWNNWLLWGWSTEWRPTRDLANELTEKGVAYALVLVGCTAVCRLIRIRFRLGGRPFKPGRGMDSPVRILHTDGRLLLG